MDSSLEIGEIESMTQALDQKLQALERMDPLDPLINEKIKEIQLLENEVKENLYRNQKYEIRTYIRHLQSMGIEFQKRELTDLFSKHPEMINLIDDVIDEIMNERG